MKTTKRRLLLFVLFLQLIFGQLFSQPKFITLQTGQPITPVGVNMAWINQGNWNGYDFGSDITFFDEARFTQIIQEIRAAGGNSARWWLHFIGEYSPLFDANGLCTGINPVDTTNLRRALDIAWDNGVVMCLTLWSIDMLDDDQGFDIQRNIDLIENRVNTMAYVNNALIPIVQKFNNHPGVLCWEIMNEPEGGVGNFGGAAGWQDGRVSFSGIQQFVNLTAGAINRTDVNTPVTVGAWSFWAMSDVFKDWWAQAHNYYNPDSLIAKGGDPDGTLDIYQVHYYPTWFEKDRSPLHNPSSHWLLDKPVMIGEFPAFGVLGSYGGVLKGEELTPSQCFEYAFRQGYVGAYAWSHPVHNTEYGGIADATPGLQYMRNKYNGAVDVQKNFNINKPLVLYQQIDTTVYPSTFFPLYVVALGSNNSYMWYISKDKVNYTIQSSGRVLNLSADVIAGTKSDGTKEIGYFKCVATNSLGTSTSSVIEVTLTAEKAKFVTQPVDATAAIGSTATFTTEFVRNPIYQYEIAWYQNGVKLNNVANKYKITNTNVGNNTRSVLSVYKVTAAYSDDDFQCIVKTKYYRVINGRNTLLYTVQNASSIAFLNRTYGCSTVQNPDPNNFIDAASGNLVWETDIANVVVNEGQAFKINFTINDVANPIGSIKFAFIKAGTGYSPETIMTPVSMTRSVKTWSVNVISKTSGVYQLAYLVQYSASVPADFIITNYQICKSNSAAAFTVTASPGPHGDIIPSGSTSVPLRGSLTCNIIPRTNYHILDVLVDNVSKGAITSFAFQNISANHTISASFASDVANLYEAEEAQLNVTEIGSDPLASNGQYTFIRGYDPNPVNNPSITWTVTVPEDGAYDLNIGYNLPFGDKTQSLLINGAWSSVLFTGPVEQWLETTVRVSLHAGVNTIKMEASWGWMYVDYITVNKYIAPPPSYLEAELASLSGTGISIITDAARSNGQYVYIDAYNATSNPKITWNNVLVDLAGTYSITIRYNVPYGYKEQALIVNGSWLGNFPFNGGATEWKDTVINVSLLSTANTIALEASWGYINIDYIDVKPFVPPSPDLEAEFATLTGTGISIVNDAARSNGQYVYMDAYNATSNPKITWSNVTVDQAATYEMTISYNVPYGYKEQAIIVNGVWLGNFPFNGGAAEWKDTIVDVALNAGTNEIAIEASWGYMNVDFISINTGLLKSTSQPFATNKVDKYQVYPNPATDYISIGIGLNEDNTKVYFYLLNDLGQIVLHKDYGTFDSGTYKLNLNIDNANIRKGLYHYRLITGKEQFTGKLIIE